MSSSGSKSGAVATSSNSPTPTPQAAIHVSAIQLASDYSANEVAADAKYKNNLLQVNGTVDSISNDFLNDPYVSLSDGKDDDGLGDVQCDFSQSSKSQLATLSKGQSITVQGTDAGMTLETVSLQSCTLVQ